MCENLIIVSIAEQARSRYHLESGPRCLPIKTPCLVSGGDLTWIVTSKEPGALQTMRFGFTPHRSDKRIYQLNQRTDVVSIGEDNSDSMMGVFMRC